MAALATPDVEQTAIVAAVASVQPPSGVRLRRFFFDEDHSGDPAIRVIFGVTKKIALTPARVRELVRFTTAVTAKLYGLPTSRIPYVTLEDMR